jgi:hypothetical protein
MRLAAVALFLLVFAVPVTHASRSWASLHKSYIVDSTWRGTYDWGIEQDDSPDLSPVLCAGDTCVVTAGPRTGLGPWNGLCDSGGLCTGSGVMHAPGWAWVTVPSGTSWENAYRAFIAKYGSSGRVDGLLAPAKKIMPEGHPAWGVLCVGFLSLPKGQGIGNLSPSTTCGLVNRPELVCKTDVTPVVDLGVVNTGRQEVATADGRLNITCSSDASVSAALTREHQIAGVPLHMEIAGKPMTTTIREIYRGNSTSLPITIHATGNFESTGEFQESVPILVTYY